VLGVSTTTITHQPNTLLLPPAEVPPPIPPRPARLQKKKQSSAATSPTDQNEREKPGDADPEDLPEDNPVDDDTPQSPTTKPSLPPRPLPKTAAETAGLAFKGAFWFSNAKLTVANAPRSYMRVSCHAQIGYCRSFLKASRPALWRFTSWFFFLALHNKRADESGNRGILWSTETCMKNAEQAQRDYQAEQLRKRRAAQGNQVFRGEQVA